MMTDLLNRILPLLRGLSSLERVYFAAPEWPDKGLVERIRQFVEDSGIAIQIGNLRRAS